MSRRVSRNTWKRKANSSMLDESLKRLIQRELREIDALLSRADELLNIAENEEPSFERLAALAQILTSFYSGLERIFERIARSVDSSIPEGQRWHSELLGQVAGPTPNREAVISVKSRTRLREYLAFRHRSRHTYAHHLEWRSMENLVGQLADTWKAVRSEIQRFLDRPENLGPKAPAPAML